MKKIICILWILLFSSININCGKGLNALFDKKKPPAIETPTTADPLNNEIIHVSTLGKDDNSGTKDSPLQTIQAGIQLAATKSFKKIFISGGLYTLDKAFISLINGISLFGGYSSDFTSRDEETIIQSISSSGGTLSNPNKTLYFSSLIDNSTLVDGLTIIGGEGDYSAGILLDGGSPVIQNCKLDGGTASIESTGIMIITSDNVIIERNYINGGSSSDSSGIALYSNSSANVNNNCINGGDAGNVTTGIYIDNSEITVLYNTINGGSAVDESIGITIYNLDLSQNVNIENNIIFSSAGDDRLGIYELSKNADPASVKNNNIFNCQNGLYVDYKNISILFLVNIKDVNSLVDTTLSEGNISEDPVFEDETLKDWHLTALTPEVVRQSGLNGIDEGYDIGTIDKDGIKRPGSGNPWSIGAYQ